MKLAAPNDKPKIGRTRKWLTISITFALTVLATLLFINLKSGEKQIRFEMKHEFAVNDPQFIRSIGQLLGPPLVPGNRIVALHNGVQIFPAMLAAIRGARETITFESYIYWSGDIGRQFSEALSERARAGVKVHVLLDAVGAGKLGVFDEDKSKSRQMTRAEFKDRSAVGKLFDRVSVSLRRQL